MAPLWDNTMARVSQSICYVRPVEWGSSSQPCGVSGKEYETFRCADLYPIVYGMEYMDKRGCSYQQFKDEADCMR